MDRYVISEFIPPFFFGVGAFLCVLVGVNLLYEVLKAVFREGFPAVAAAKIFMLKMPGMITMTLPMATMFGSLMAIGRLSGDGEVVAMRASGTGVPRIGAAVMIAGLAVSVGSLAINETLVPPCNSAAFEVARSVRETVAARGDLGYEVRAEDGRLQRWLYAESFDPESLRMSNVTILDFTLGSRPHTFTAESARWQGETWVMENVEHRWHTRRGELEEDRASWLAIPIGRTPEEIQRVTKDPEDMTLSEARAQAELERARGNPWRAGWILQHIQIRLATPWAAVGLAVLGVPLGLRRHRSSRGIGMGLSLVVIFLYYVVFHIVSLVGERGVVNPVLVAWTPNLLLYLTGLGLLLKSSR